MNNQINNKANEVTVNNKKKSGCNNEAQTGAGT